MFRRKMEIKKLTSRSIFVSFCRVAQVFFVIGVLLWVGFGYEKRSTAPPARAGDLQLVQVDEVTQLSRRLNDPVPVQAESENDDNSDKMPADKKIPASAERSTMSKFDSRSQYPRQFCLCDKNKRFVRKERNSNRSIVSTCSQEATDLGPRQRVISFSLYTNKKIESDSFYKALEPTLQESKILYPGWVSRIYTNVSVQNPLICPLICKYPAVFWCDIKNVPEMGDMSKLDERCWRFLPLGDPTVDIFISRDLDYQFTLRERAAVAEWEMSTFAFHTMRDHPLHSIGMLAGTWGAKNSLLGSDLSKSLQSQLIAEERQYQENWDQEILNLHVYVSYRHLVLAHDSYQCGNYDDGKTLPFSVQRFGGEMIGFRNLGNESTLAKCPEECRPEYGKNWEYC